MGYVLKDIANIDPPARLSLSGLPNFIQVSSKTVGGNAYRSRVVPTSPTEVTLTVQDSYGGVRVVVVSVNVDPMVTAENLRAALLGDAFIFANYEVFADYQWNGGAPTVNGVVLQAKKAGTEFNLTIAPVGATATILTAGTNNDTIRGAEPVVEVSVDLYRLSADQYIRQQPPAGGLGAFMVTMSKTYDGRPVWFDLNGVAAQFNEFTTPVLGWFNTGTLMAYRGLVRAGEQSQTPIYITEVLYALTGYGQLGQPLDFQPYLFTGGTVKLLTDKPVTGYIRGQREYLSFLLGAPLTGQQIGVLLRAYDGAGRFLGATTLYNRPAAQFTAVNSCGFTFDALLDQYPNAVRISAALAMGGAILSEEALYDVRPDCYHVRNEFYFLNRLGGWDTFNFDGPDSEESRPVQEGYSRTVTPDYDAAHGVDAIYLADLDSSITVQGLPVNGATADWLKQLVAAKVILDKEGRRVIIDDMTLRNTAGELTTPTIKYRLSETYTNGY